MIGDIRIVVCCQSPPSERQQWDCGRMHCKKRKVASLGGFFNRAPGAFGQEWSFDREGANDCSQNSESTHQLICCVPAFDPEPSSRIFLMDGVSMLHSKSDPNYANRPSLCGNSKTGA